MYVLLLTSLETGALIKIIVIHLSQQNLIVLILKQTIDLIVIHLSQP